MSAKKVKIVIETSANRFLVFQIGTETSAARSLSEQNLLILNDLKAKVTNLKDRYFENDLDIKAAEETIRLAEISAADAEEVKSVSIFLFFLLSLVSLNFNLAIIRLSQSLYTSCQHQSLVVLDIKWRRQSVFGHQNRLLIFAFLFLFHVYRLRCCSAISCWGTLDGFLD